MFSIIVLSLELVLVVVLVLVFLVVRCRRWRGRGKDRGELLSLSPTQGDYITCSITDQPSHGFVSKCAERELKPTTNGGQQQKNKNLLFRTFLELGWRR